MPVLASLGTAVPPHRVEQRELRDLAAEVLSEHAPLLARLAAVFDSSGIATRHFVEPLDWYLAPRGWKERTDAFLRHAPALSREATEAALARADLRPADVDAVVFVSTTGLATPSIEARLANALGFRDDVTRLPVWGLGCAGGVAGLARARDLAAADPEARVLLVALETCSLSFQFGAFTKATAVAASLFADGAAAAIVAGDEAGLAGPRLVAAESRLFPQSERVMGWDVEDYGLSVVFSPEIPAIVEREMGPLVAGFLKRRSDGAAPSRWLLHPGGAKVLRAYETALGLPAERFAESYDILRRRGNMSSPTALFVAEQSLARPLAAGERALLGALGPGFASELVLLEG